MFDMLIIEPQSVSEITAVSIQAQQNVKPDYIFKVCNDLSYGYGYPMEIAPLGGLSRFLKLDNYEKNISWKLISLPKYGVLQQNSPYTLIYTPNGKFERTDKVEFFVTYKNKTYRVISTLLIREFINENLPRPCEPFLPQLIPTGSLNLDINNVMSNLVNKNHRWY